jgi:hypothetical protein
MAVRRKGRREMLASATSTTGDSARTTYSFDLRRRRDLERGTDAMIRRQTERSWT